MPIGKLEKVHGGICFKRNYAIHFPCLVKENRRVFTHWIIGIACRHIFHWETDEVKHLNHFTGTMIWWGKRLEYQIVNGWLEKWIKLWKRVWKSLKTSWTEHLPKKSITVETQSPFFNPPEFSGHYSQQWSFQVFSLSSIP